MAFEKMGSFTFNHADQADELNLAADTAKQKFDSRANELKTAFNKAVDLLNSTVDGNSGADNVGATEISGLPGKTVQTLLEALNNAINTHKTETAITEHKTITVGASGCDYTTIARALSSIETASIASPVTVTIQLQGETYNHSAFIKVGHASGSNIRIIGAEPIITTASAVGAITGSAGNYSVPITVASVTGMKVGQYAILRNTNGTGDHECLQGVWEITAIANNVVTLKNTFRGAEFPAATLTEGNFVVLTTTLKFSDTNGIVVDRSALGYLDNVAIVGNGSAFYYGVYSTTGASIICGQNVAVSGFKSGFFAINRAGITAPATVASNNTVGYEGSGFAGIYINNCITNGNIEKGAHITAGAGMMAVGMFACGNKSGLVVDNGGAGFSTGIVAKVNTENNIECHDTGALFAPGAIAVNAGLIDIFAYNEGYVRCSDYVGTPAFSPEPNSEGNKGSWIIT